MTIYNNPGMEKWKCHIIQGAVQERINIIWIKTNPITQVLINGNVTIRWGDLQERISIRWIKPYHK